MSPTRKPPERAELRFRERDTRIVGAALAAIDRLHGLVDPASDAADGARLRPAGQDGRSG